MFIALEDNDKWYGLHAKSSEVVREKIASFDALITDFDHPLNQSDLIYIHCDDVPKRLTTLFGDKLTPTDVSLNAIPPQYGLKPLNRFSAKYGFAIGALSLCAIGGLFALSQSEPPPPPPVNPWESWSQHYLSLNTAEHALQSGALLVSLGWGLPIDWQLKGVAQVGDTINLTIEPRVGAKQATLMAWLKNRPNITTVIVEGQNVLLSIPLKTKQEPVLYVVGDYHHRLYDNLSRLGVKNITMVNSPGSNNTQQWTYQFSLSATNLNMLSTLSKLLENQPVFMTNFTITALTPPLLDATMTLTLIGQ
ncbi:hypothetical protein L2748_21390 [Shewanella sairae]|nr:hypothetical protein [Shewanella sairae]MCL1132239.1 hypothetical protein [Shewanella sairae]